MCPFCNSDRGDDTDEQRVEETMMQVEVNDPTSICLLATYYDNGLGGLQQDCAKAVELWKQASKLGSRHVHFELGVIYHEWGDLKKDKFHYKAAAMAGHKVARYNLGYIERASGNVERALKHLRIVASAGSY